MTASPCISLTWLAFRRPRRARQQKVTTPTDGQAGAVGRPLDGILVVALEQAVAAPFATRQLADLGGEMASAGLLAQIA